jgi:hypothetical protein
LASALLESYFFRHMGGQLDVAWPLSSSALLRYR